MKRKTVSKKNSKSGTSLIQNILENLRSLNTNKFFAGMMMITMNIASKHITIDISKSQEAYVKYTLGRQILIFAVLWMGTRDIVIALILTAVFIVLADYLFNENSKFCILPEKYKDLHMLLDTDGDGKISEKEINDAIHVLKKAKMKKDGNKEAFDINLAGLAKENFI
jgi:hypothetical protein